MVRRDKGLVSQEGGEECGEEGEEGEEGKEGEEGEEGEEGKEGQNISSRVRKEEDRRGNKVR